MRSILSTIPLALAIAACSTADTAGDPQPATPPRTPPILAGERAPDDAREVHLTNLRQITFGGENAEAYWSFDGSMLIMQSRQSPEAGDQIYTVDLATGARKLVSTGTARTTCSYFLKGDRGILFASTHGDGPQVPMVERIRGRYVWGVFQSYDIWAADLDGSNLRQLTDAPGYDAEATVCPVTGRIVFTSVRDGDLELYTMAEDGSDVQRLTNRLGYDGGAFFSHDGKKLVQRSGFLKTEAEEREYLDLLARGLVTPSRMEITVLDRDGSNFRQVTDNGKANFAPFWHPDNQRILFSSNMQETDPRSRNFDIYMIREDGTGLEQITFSAEFDGFPMFSPDGRHLAFSSNRFAESEGDTNVFVAEWRE